MDPPWHNVAVLSSVAPEWQNVAVFSSGVATVSGIDELQVSFAEYSLVCRALLQKSYCLWGRKTLHSQRERERCNVCTYAYIYIYTYMQWESERAWHSGDLKNAWSAERERDVPWVFEPYKKDDILQKRPIIMCVLRTCVMRTHALFL